MDSVVLVPVVQQNDTVVSSFLACDVSADTVLIKLIRDQDYQNYSFENSKGSLTANGVAIEFMAFQKKVFCDSVFSIRDERLFNYTNDSGNLIKPTHVTVRSAAASGNGGATMLVAISWTECYNVIYDGDRGQLTGVEPGGSLNYSYSTTVCYTNTVWVEGGGGGSTSGGSTGGTGTSGGGGGSTWYDGGTAPCPTSVARTSIIAPTDGCSTGWTPVATVNTELDIKPNPYVGYPVSNGVVIRYYNNNLWNNLATVNAGKYAYATDNLRALGKMRGWDVGVDAVTFNKKVGKAFEETALSFYSLKENRYNYDAPERKLRNAPNPPTKVRPDALDNYTCMWYDKNSQSHTAQLERTFATEVKAYKGTLELSSNSYQILGELELLRNNFDLQANMPY